MILTNVKYLKTQAWNLSSNFKFMHQIKLFQLHMSLLYWLFILSFFIFCFINDIKVNIQSFTVAQTFSETTNR